MISLRKLHTGIYLAAIMVIAVGTSLVWGIGIAGCIVISDGASPEKSGPESFWMSNQDIIWFSPAAVPSTSIKSVSRGVTTDSTSPSSGHKGMVFKNRAGARYFFASNNIIVRFGGNQACHYLDIPPPATPLFL